MKYISILSAISCATAFSLSKKRSKCVERCNQLPFKVSIETRRKACLAGCGSPDVDPSINAEIRSSHSNDATCIEHCNAQEGSRRSKRACIKQCSASSEYYESTNRTHPSEVEAITSAEFDLQSDGIKSVDASSSIKVDLQDEKSKYENITSIELKSSTRLSLQENAHSVNSTSSTETSHAETELKEILETESESESQTLREESNDLSANNTGLTTTAAHLMNGTKKNELQTSDHGSFAVAPNTTEMKIKPASDTRTHAQNETRSMGTFATPTSNSYDAPSVVPAAAPHTTSNTSSQNDTLSVHLESEVNTSSVDYSKGCIDRCNGKRTLKRKREACLKRCRSSIPYDLTSALKQGYASSKIEL